MASSNSLKLETYKQQAYNVTGEGPTLISEQGNVALTLTDHNAVASAMALSKDAVTQNAFVANSVIEGNKETIQSLITSLNSQNMSPDLTNTKDTLKTVIFIALIFGGVLAVRG